MKKLLSLGLCLLLMLSLSVPVLAAGDQDLQQSLQVMKPVLLLQLGILAVLLISSIVFTVAGAGKRASSVRVTKVLLYIATLLVLVCVIFCILQYKNTQDAYADSQTAPTDVPTTESVPETTEEETVPPTTEEETVPPTLPPEPTLDPKPTEFTDPVSMGINWQVIQNGDVVESYQRSEAISFGSAQEYTDIAGVISFRGNNYRTDPSYGTASVVSGALQTKWNNGIGSLDGWTGVGWTGQPLIVQWDAETRSNLGLYAGKRTKDGLVEVICTTLDGNIYFYDLEDGTYTRDPIYMGMQFKGTASLDPRGYPILYAGSGLVYGKSPRMYAVDLTQNKIIWEHSGADSYTLRSWYAFDSSPMISAETDTIIWPGESGILYTVKLNSGYDKATGKVTFAPDEPVAARYSTSAGRTLGFESSCIVVDHYAFVGDNGGMFFCVDLNTMGLVWAQNIGDDLNGTPVFKWEDGTGYLYLGTSMEYGGGTCNFFKIDANSGEIVWKHPFSNIIYDKDVSGGFLASPILGEPGTELEGLVVCAVAKTPAAYSGVLFALDTQTGESVWEKRMENYAWSSPVAVYNADGTAHIVICDSVGYMYLYNAKGELRNTISLGSNIEASPAAFDNMLVVGTRGQRICGVELS